MFEGPWLSIMSILQSRLYKASHGINPAAAAPTHFPPLFSWPYFYLNAFVLQTSLIRLSPFDL